LVLWGVIKKRLPQSLGFVQLGTGYFAMLCSSGASIFGIPITFNLRAIKK